MSAWVTIATFSSRIEADVVKSLLESSGIVSRVSADDMGGMGPQLALTSGVQLLVEEKNAEDARALIQLD